MTNPHPPVDETIRAAIGAVLRWAFPLVPLETLPPDDEEKPEDAVR